MRIINVLVVCFLLLVTPDSTLAKEWRGIIPLHSTRANVERLLGPPKKPLKKHVADYRLENEDISILYATGPPCGNDSPSGWKVPAGTVVSITVVPGKKLRFPDLKIDKSKYKRMDGGEQPFVSYYINTEEGIKFATFEDDLVTSISYFAAEADNYLLCHRAKSPQQPLDKLTSKQKNLLDRFVLRLTQDSTVKGWIRIDRERRRVTDTQLTDLVIQYLKSNHAKEFSRVSVMGAYGLVQEMELVLLPRDGDPIPFQDKVSNRK